jgi:hypothetical protein
LAIQKGLKVSKEAKELLIEEKSDKPQQFEELKIDKWNEETVECG